MAESNPTVSRCRFLDWLSGSNMSLPLAGLVQQRVPEAFAILDSNLLISLPSMLLQRYSLPGKLPCISLHKCSA